MAKMELPEYNLIQLFERAKEDPSWEEDPVMRNILAESFLFLLQFAF